MKGETRNIKLPKKWQRKLRENRMIQRKIRIFIHVASNHSHLQKCIIASVQNFDGKFNKTDNSDVNASYLCNMSV